MNASQRFSSDDSGRLLLRLALGSMWLTHGLLLKVLTYGIDGFAAFLAASGLPSVLAWPIVLAEIIGGQLILAGWHGRWVSAALLPILLGATWIHAGNGWVFSAANGGWEYPVFLAVASLVHLLLGDGAYAVSGTAAPRPLPTAAPSSC